MDVEVQDAWRINVTRFPEFVEDVKRLAANLQHTNDDAAVNWKEKLFTSKIFLSLSGEMEILAPLGHATQ